MSIEARNEVPAVDLDGAGVVAIPCGGSTHRGRPTGDALDLDDHDVGAELTLLALGSEVPPCLLYLAVWQQAIAKSWTGQCRDLLLTLSDGSEYPVRFRLR
jgi:hypothetical protein